MRGASPDTCVTNQRGAHAPGGMTISNTQPNLAMLSAPPDIVGDSLTADAIELRAVSFRGSAHTLFDEPRQDSFALDSNEEWVVAVVSDGVGSCEHSHHGSSAAASAVARAISSGDLDPHDGSAVLAAACSASAAAAHALHVAPNMVATTLTVASVERSAQPDRSRHVLLHAVGDSPAMLLGPAPALWRYLTPTSNGPGNVVRNWVPDRTDDIFSAGLALPAEAILVIATDGFTTPLGDGTGQLGADLAARWSRGPREIFAFMVDLSFNAYHDDKTVVAVWNSARRRADEPADSL